jgi:hypothetical protein
LCFGFSQITNKTPLRFTILHLAQRFLIEDETFIPSFLLLDRQADPYAAKDTIIPSLAFFVQSRLQQGHNQRSTFRHCHGMLEVSRK